MHSRAAEASIVTVNLQPGQQVSQDPRYWFQLIWSDGTTIDRTSGLPGEPLIDAGATEGVLTVGSLKRFLKDTTTDGADELLINRV